MAVKQTSLEFEKPKTKNKREYKPFIPGPNPELPDFIKRHAIPYDPATDDYDVPAFDKDIIVDKAAPPKAIRCRSSTGAVLWLIPASTSFTFGPGLSSSPFCTAETGDPAECRM